MKSILLLITLLIIQISFSQSLEELRAVKITNVDSYVLYNDKNIASAMDYLASIGINTILPVVWNKGYTLYPSNVMKNLFNVSIIPEFSGRDPLNRLIIEAHRNGMEVLPWYEYGFASHPSGGSAHITNKFPSWALRDTGGKFFQKNEFYWMSAINPQVQDFIISITTEVLDNYDVDGVEYSDRIPAMPIEGGYDSVTVAIYKQENGGATPPKDFHNYYWMRWRADKLNQWYKRVRDSVKIRSNNFFLASSPSQYPWSYDEYLQDSKTWVDSGIVDNIIPQLYRYNFNDYLFELNKALTFIPTNKRDLIFAGILMNIGTYVMTPEFLLNSLKANRDRNVQGEAFFFYEGLRKNNNRLGDTLKATYYKNPALVPHRNKNVWRPKATIASEKDSNVIITGKWQTLAFPGFDDNFLMASDSGYNSITYNFDVPFSAYFGIYVYIVPNTTNTKTAPYTIYSGNDSTIIMVDQTKTSIAGWYKLTDVYLSKGFQKVIKLDNNNIGAGKYIIGECAMIMINRKLSPDVVVTNIEKDEKQNSLPTKFNLFQNYPNPFNPTTTIDYEIPTSPNSSHLNKGEDRMGSVTLKIYDILGRVIETLVDAQHQPGKYSVQWNATNCPTGVYFYELKIGSFNETKKMILIK